MQLHDSSAPKPSVALLFQEHNPTTECSCHTRSIDEVVVQVPPRGHPFATALSIDYRLRDYKILNPLFTNGP